MLREKPYLSPNMSMEGEARWGRAAVIPAGPRRNGPFGSGSPGLEQSRAMTVGRKCWKLDSLGIPLSSSAGSTASPRARRPYRPPRPSKGQRSGLGCAGLPGPRLAGARLGLCGWPGARAGCCGEEAPREDRTGQDRRLLRAEPPVRSSKGPAECLLPPSPWPRMQHTAQTTQ